MHLCREMKWTYEDYLNQPGWLIQVLSEQLIDEAKQAKRMNK